jgi:hypothetical protein
MRVVLVNFTAERKSVDIREPRTVEVASDGTREGMAFDGTLAPDEAIVLR